MFLNFSLFEKKISDYFVKFHSYSVPLPPFKCVLFRLNSYCSGTDLSECQFSPPRLVHQNKMQTHRNVIKGGGYYPVPPKQFFCFASTLWIQDIDLCKKKISILVHLRMDVDCWCSVCTLSTFFGGQKSAQMNFLY